MHARLKPQRPARKRKMTARGSHERRVIFASGHVKFHATKGWRKA